MLNMLEIRLGNAKEWYVDEEAEKLACDRGGAPRHIDWRVECTLVRPELIECMLAVALRMTVAVCGQTSDALVRATVKVKGIDLQTSRRIHAMRITIDVSRMVAPRYQ